MMGMTQGDGENSYLRNSMYQETAMRKVLPIFFDSIKSMKLPDHEKILRIADFGCSCSQNSITIVKSVVNQVRARYREVAMGDSELEIQAFVQDLPSNDFNTLIKLQFSQPRSDDEKAPSYMSAAVPGSFYNRLFPKSTINVAISSFALHWLSQIPAAVTDKGSPAYNGGHIHIYHSSLATVEAYAEQADKDLDNFLAARAHEIATGGILFLTFVVRQNEFFPYQEGGGRLDERVMNGLVLEGTVSEELRDSLNVRLYYRTLDEVNTQLDKYSTDFEVQEQQIIPYSFYEWSLAFPDARDGARAGSRVMRGTSAGYVEAYFGKEASDLFFERWEEAYHEFLKRWKSASNEEKTDKPFVLLALGLRRK